MRERSKPFALPMGRFPKAGPCLIAGARRRRGGSALLAGALLASMTGAGAWGQGAPAVAPAATATATAPAAAPAPVANNPPPSLPPPPVLGGEVGGFGGAAGAPHMGSAPGGPCCGSAPNSVMNPQTPPAASLQSQPAPPPAARSVGIPMDLVLIIAVIAFLLGWFSRRPPKLA